MTSAAEAQLLLKQGRVLEAERAFASLLDAEPGNIEALNVMALAALRERNLTAAHSMIERALIEAPDDPMTLHNRGRIYEAATDYTAAAAAQRAALRSAPNFHAAKLFLGRALDLGGHADEAVVTYARALQDAQQEGRWLQRDSTPLAFQPIIERAVTAVRIGRRAAIAALLEPLYRQFGRSSMTRVEKSLRIYFNEEAITNADPRQRSTFFHFPDIPATPYLDLALFDWIDRVEASTARISGELLALLPHRQGQEPVFGSTALEADHLRGVGHAPAWNGFYFYRHGEARRENGERCPATAAMLESLPLCRVREHGPEVLFSVFAPGTHLLPHRGVTNTRVVAHLPLIVPDDCALVVGGEEHRWREGKVVVFDDTYEHEAWNRSDKIRVVLIFDLWSPYLSEVERAAIELVIGDIGDFRHKLEVSN